MLVLIISCLAVFGLSWVFFFNKEIKISDRIMGLSFWLVIANIVRLGVINFDEIINLSKGVYFIIFYSCFICLFCFSLLLLENKIENGIRQYLFGKIIMRAMLVSLFYGFQFFCFDFGLIKNISLFDNALILILSLIFAFVSIRDLYYFTKGILFKPKTEEIPAQT